MALIIPPRKICHQLFHFNHRRGHDPHDAHKQHNGNPKSIATAELRKPAGQRCEDEGRKNERHQRESERSDEPEHLAEDLAKQQRGHDADEYESNAHAPRKQCAVIAVVVVCDAARRAFDASLIPRSLFQVPAAAPGCGTGGRAPVVGPAGT